MSDTEYFQEKAESAAWDIIINARKHLSLTLLAAIENSDAIGHKYTDLEYSNLKDAIFDSLYEYYKGACVVVDDDAINVIYDYVKIHPRSYVRKMLTNPATPRFLNDSQIDSGAL